MKNRAAKTLLVMTDCNDSVIEQLELDQTRTGAYCPFGYTTAHSDTNALSGFNGQMQEGRTNAYNLGNGYRTYHPILRRFDRPDHWSPFGLGGLNAYVYCDSDPVNNVDPDGHISLLNRLRRLFGRSRPASDAMTDIKMLGPGPLAFTDNPGPGRRLNFLAHGTDPNNIGTSAGATATNRTSPQQLLNLYQSKGGRLEGVESYRLLTCFSASGDASYASRMAKLTGKATEGFEGKVFVSVNAQDIQAMINAGSKKISTTGAKISYKPGIKVYKRNPYSRKNPMHDQFNYRPRSFIPSKADAIRQPMQ